MVEPHSTAAGAIAGGVASSVTLLLGVHPDALVLGLVCAILASIWMETIDGKAKAAAAVLLSAVLAGYGSPVMAQVLSGYFPTIEFTDQLRLLSAAVIGLACPSLVPMAVNVLGKKAGAAQ